MNMPSTELCSDDLDLGEIGVLTLLVKTGLAPSNAEARRLVQGGGVSIDDQKVSDPKMTVPADRLRAGVVIKRAKKSFTKRRLYKSSGACREKERPLLSGDPAVVPRYAFSPLKPLFFVNWNRLSSGKPGSNLHICPFAVSKRRIRRAAAKERGRALIFVF